MEGYRTLHEDKEKTVNLCSRYSDIGLIVIKDVIPMHYYALFSITRGKMIGSYIYIYIYK